MRRILLTLATMALALPTAVRLVGDHGRLALVLLAVATPFVALPLSVLLAARSTGVLALPGSDHRALLARLVLRPQP